MTIDIHKIVIGNPISKNLMKPWGSNSKPNSLRRKLFNRYTGPGNLVQQQVDFNPYTGQTYKVYDPPSSKNDRCLKIYYTNSNLKAVVIERFNRSLRELMMKEFVKNNNTVWYNILPKLIKIYNNRFHNTIKDKPININKSNEKYIKNTIYKYNITNKIP